MKAMKAMKLMKAMNVSISVSDPWDLGESLKWRPLLGELMQSSSDDRGGRALIRLGHAIDYRGTSYGFVVAVPRHEGATLAALAEGGRVFCSFTGVSDEHAQSENALSTDHWRGGLAFIGDIEAAG